MTFEFAATREGGDGSAFTAQESAEISTLCDSDPTSDCALDCGKDEGDCAASCSASCDQDE